MIIERRVIMVSRGARLGTLAVQALGLGRSLACLESPADLDDWTSPPVDVVLLDFPRRQRGIVYRQLRQRYRGPVLALLDPGDDGGGLPSNRGPLAILHRPFSGEELMEALNGLFEPSDDGDPAAPALEPPPAPDAGTSAAPALEAPSAPAAPQAPPATAPAPVPLPTPQLFLTGASADDGRDWAPPSRWEALARFGVRRWQVVVAVVAIALLGLSFGAPSPCRSGCANVAGASEDTVIGGGALVDPATGTSSPGLKGATASSTGRSAVPGAPPSATSAIGGLISSIGGGSSALLPPLGTSGGAPVPVGGAAPPPTTAPRTSPAPATRPPATTSPPTTRPPATTRPPTTAPPPPTTAPPPPTTAPPPPTTAPPPPTTAPPPPPPPPPPTTAAV